ncbi:MAG: ATP-dependent 6-phosphofructokinase [Pirellulaceae bacterium]|nr:ATP-dependent 6-phosphofructokinase [Pirellulaceae bacterium]
MTHSKAERIGILTSGGDCPGLNAVIRGTYKAARQLGYEVIGFQKGYEGLVDPVSYVHLDDQSTAGILIQGGTILGSTNKGRFAAISGENTRIDLDPQLLRGVRRTIDELNVRALVCIGGDGSLAVAQQFHEQGIPVVGVPKTIDNDLSCTAFTFGFDSAVSCATDALDRLHTTAASHERTMVLEVMGRHAGWIALHAGIAGGADCILIPEIAWSYDNICSKILSRRSAGRNFTLIIVAEGATLPDGDLVTCEQTLPNRRASQPRRVEDRQVRLGGVGNIIATELSDRLHTETRSMLLGHLQRGGGPTPFDRFLATQYGVHAMRLVAGGQFGRMVCYQPPNVSDVMIADAIGQLNKVDPLGAAVQTARGLGISFGDLLPEGSVFGPVSMSASPTTSIPASSSVLLPTSGLPVPTATLSNF